MKTELTSQQLLVVKGMMEYAQAFADQMYHIMKNHGLDKIDGCNVLVNIDPKLNTSTESIYFGDTVETDFGKIRMEKGNTDKKFCVVGRNSAKYELLFANDELKEVMKKILTVSEQKPLPMDGLWIGKDYGEE